MDNIVHLVTWYPLFLVPAGIGWGAVVVTGGKHFDLLPADKALLVAPWVVLFAASLLFPDGKSIANLAEVVILAACVPGALLVRTVRGRAGDQARRANLLLAGVCAAALLLWLLIPPLQ